MSGLRKVKRRAVILIMGYDATAALAQIYSQQINSNVYAFVSTSKLADFHDMLG